MHVLLAEPGPRRGVRDPEREPHLRRAAAAVHGRHVAGHLLHGGAAGGHPADPEQRLGAGAGGGQAPARAEVCEHRGLQDQTRTVQEPGERGERPPAEAQERPGGV